MMNCRVAVLIGLLLLAAYRWGVFSSTVALEDTDAVWLAPRWEGNRPAGLTATKTLRFSRESVQPLAKTFPRVGPLLPPSRLYLTNDTEAPKGVHVVGSPVAGDINCDGFLDVVLPLLTGFDMYDLKILDFAIYKTF